MTQEELRQRVQVLLQLEEAPDVDWNDVEVQCQELSREIERMPVVEVPDLLYHFVDDADIRQKSARYADEQRMPLWQYVKTGEMVEHAPSTAISWWGCLLMVAAVAGLLAVLIR